MSKMALRKAIAARKAEIESYESEAAIHQSVLAGLPDLPVRWPADFEVFRGSDRTTLVRTEMSDQDRQTIIDLQQRDLSRGAMLEVNFELTRCRRYLAALESQFDPGDVGPTNKAESALQFLEGMRLSGEIKAYAIDENTLSDFGQVATVAVVITRPDDTTKRRILMVNESGVQLIHSAN